jgi:hypothetical protein
MHTITKCLPKSALIVLLAAVVLFGSSCSVMRTGTPANNVIGKWDGSITVPNQGDIKLIFEFFKNADGDLRGFLSVPQQSDQPLFIENVTLDGSALQITIENIGASYSATLDGSKLDGEFSQGGGKFPLVVERVN